VAGLTQIAEVEGPVHIDLVLERAREWWGLGRVSARVRDNVLRAIRRTGLTFNDDFLDVEGRPVRAVRVSSGNASRKAEHVHIDELGLAAELLVRDAGGAARAEVVTGVSRAFGWKRTSSGSEVRISMAIDSAIAGGRLVEQDGHLRTPTVPATEAG
jgi:hypothetical protein